MTVTIPHGVKAELVRRTKPVGRREAGDVGAAAAEEALAASTARLVDLLGQHLEPDEELRDVSTSSGYKTGPRVGCAVRVSLLSLTDRRILHVLEDQVKGVAPIVHPYDYGSLTVRGKRMHLGGPTVVVEPDGVVVETRKGKVDEVTARLSAAPPRAEWLTTAWSAGGAGGQGGDGAAQPPAWHPDPTGRHEYRWWDGSAWTSQVADGGVASSDPLPEA